jgi:hypothetical protein
MKVLRYSIAASPMLNRSLPCPSLSSKKTERISGKWIVEQITSDSRNAIPKYFLVKLDSIISKGIELRQSIWQKIAPGTQNSL